MLIFLYRKVYLVCKFSTGGVGYKNKILPLTFSTLVSFFCHCGILSKETQYFLGLNFVHEPRLVNTPSYSQASQRLFLLRLYLALNFCAESGIIHSKLCRYRKLILLKLRVFSCIYLKENSAFSD